MPSRFHLDAFANKYISDIIDSTTSLPSLTTQHKKSSLSSVLTGGTAGQRGSAGAAGATAFLSSSSSSSSSSPPSSLSASTAAAAAAAPASLALDEFAGLYTHGLVASVLADLDGQVLAHSKQRTASSTASTAALQLDRFAAHFVDDLMEQVAQHHVAPFVSSPSEFDLDRYCSLCINDLMDDVVEGEDAAAATGAAAGATGPFSTLNTARSINSLGVFASAYVSTLIDTALVAALPSHSTPSASKHRPLPRSSIEAYSAKYVADLIEGTVATWFSLANANTLPLAAAAAAASTTRKSSYDASLHPPSSSATARGSAHVQALADDIVTSLVQSALSEHASPKQAVSLRDAPIEEYSI